MDFFHKCFLGFWIPFMSAIRILLFLLLLLLKDTNCATFHWMWQSLPWRFLGFIDLDEYLIVFFVPSSEKWHIIGILTSLRKVGISLNSNIQIGWNKWHSKTNTLLWRWYVFYVAITFYLQGTRALFLCLCTSFSRTPCRRHYEDLPFRHYLPHFSGPTKTTELKVKCINVLSRFDQLATLPPLPLFNFFVPSQNSRVVIFERECNERSSTWQLFVDRLMS